MVSIVKKSVSYSLSTDERSTTHIKQNWYLVKECRHGRDSLVHGTELGCDSGCLLNLGVDYVHGDGVVVLIGVVQERDHSSCMFMADGGKDGTRLDHANNNALHSACSVRFRSQTDQGRDVLDRESQVCTGEVLNIAAMQSLHALFRQTKVLVPDENRLRLLQLSPDGAVRFFLVCSSEICICHTLHLDGSLDSGSNVLGQWQDLQERRMNI